MSGAGQQPFRPNRQRQRQNLKRLLRPRHIAFVGGQVAEYAILACRQIGFDGTLWTVNPRRAEIAGIPCVASLEELPEPPDAAFVALSPERSVTAVRDLAALEAGGVVCLATGFAESGERGETVQRALVEAVGDLALVGPNCMGVLNLFDKVAVWGGGSHLPPPGDHGVAVVSQSGALVYGMLNVERGFPLGYVCSIGNQAVLGAGDFIDVLLDDPRVRAIGLYLEGLVEGGALASACLRALEKDVPIVALKGGNSAVGAYHAIGHTGTLAVDEDLWRAFATRFALVEVTTPKAMVETLKMFALAGPLKGRRLLAVTFSGGLNTLIAERAPRLGLELPAPSPARQGALAAVLPEDVRVTNPFDLNIPWAASSGITFDDAPAIARCVADLASGETDAIAFFMDIPRPGHDVEKIWVNVVAAMIEVCAITGLPCVVAGIYPEGLDENIRHRFSAAGIAPLLGFQDALDAIAAAAGYRDRRARVIEGAERGVLLVPQDRPAQQNLLTLDEWEAKKLIATAGLDVPASWAGPSHDAPEAAAQLGFPVAIKVLDANIAHKSRAGGVALNLRNREEVADATAAIGRAVAAAVLGSAAGRVLVESMIDDGIGEFLIGLRRHAALGLALVIGRGGTRTETFRDYATLLLPVSEEHIRGAVESLRVVREAERPDPLVDAVTAAACTVAQFAEMHRDSLAELDVNPLIVRRQGDAVVADALIVMAAEGNRTK